MKIAWGVNKSADLRIHNHGNFYNFCGDIYASCKPGDKAKAIYFVRGGELKENRRNNENLLSAELVVGDIDNTDIQPNIVHKILKSKNITHFIYTSSSYTTEKPKYRIITPFKTTTQEELRRVTDYFQEICQVEFAPESYVWSQEWFVSVAEETGSWFHDGDTISLPSDYSPKTKSENKSKQIDQSDGEYEDHINEMLKTGDGHNHYTPMCLSLANKGLDAKTIFQTIQPIAKIALTTHGREWTDGRDENLWACVTSALDKVRDEFPTATNLPDIEEHSIQHSDEYPPGLMGELVREFEQMSFYPNRQISTAGAITFIAGIIGRTYNINNTGLNLYTTILMDTGQGKDFLSKTISKTLLAVSPKGNAGSTFVGSTRYTGPKAVWSDLEDGMSKISVMTEAGIMNGSSSGDKENLERALLNLFTSSGEGNYIIGERYSNSKDSLKTLHSPALSLLQESTPDVFIKNLISNEGDIRGDLARMWVVRIVGDKPNINRKRSVEFSEEIMNRIGELVVKSIPNQNGDIITLEGNYTASEHMFDVADKYTEIENQARKSGEHLKRVMATRAFVKAIKITSIIDIFNGDDPSDNTFNWVCKNLIDTELKNISATFKYESSDDILDVITFTIVPTIKRILNNGYNDLKKVPRKEWRERGVFTKSNLIQCLKNHKVIRDFNSKKGNANFNHGIDVIVNYMVNNNLLYEVSKEKMKSFVSGGGNFGNGYMITSELEASISNTDPPK